MQRNGFTLVEIASVMILIGLLVGGVFVGRNMIRSSQIMSAAAEVQSYVAAADSFRKKYRELPGDFSRATTVWGVAGGTGEYTTDCYASAGTGTQTCNGNGNGQVGESAGTFGESFRFWQHLWLERLIANSFSGVAGGVGTYHHVAGVNAPLTKADGAIVAVFYTNSTMAATDFYSTRGGNFFSLGTYSGSLNLPVAAAFTTREASAIDKKLDDGKPGTGQVFSYKPATNPSCATTTSATTAVYDTSATGNRCALVFASNL